MTALADPASQSRSPGETPPPAGAPWDLPFAEAPLAFLDLEMTGLKVEIDRVIEICIERVVGGALEARFDTLIDAQGREGNAHVHGLDATALEGAPTFAAVADRVCALLKGAIVVAHGAQWDLAFLQMELQRIGREPEAPTHAIDSLVLCRRALHLHSYGLQAVATALEIPVARAHRAGDDVATLRAVFDHVVGPLAPKTARDLWDVRVGERVPRPQIVEAVEAAVAKGLPVEVLYRPAHRKPETLHLVLTALVPPHVIGYLLPGRGRRELRLDRILRVDSV